MIGLWKKSTAGVDVTKNILLHQSHFDVDEKKNQTQLHNNMVYVYTRVMRLY